MKLSLKYARGILGRMKIIMSSPHDSFFLIIAGQTANLDELKIQQPLGAILSTTTDLPLKILMNSQEKAQMPNFILKNFCINIKIYVHSIFVNK